MKYLKRAAELLRLDERKYSFLVSDENVENGMFLDFERESKDKILEYLVQFNFCTARNAKKMNLERIKNSIEILNFILNIKESQDYLNSVINGNDINDIPEIYELHHTKKRKISNSVFSEGIGMINNTQSCFIISSLQMLFHLEHYMEKLFYKNLVEDLDPIEEELKNIFAKSQEENCKPIDIKQFENIIMNRNEMQSFFCNGKTVQSDASEFLQEIHKLLKPDYKNLFQIPAFDEFLSEFLFDVKLDNIAAYGLNNEIMKSFSKENLNKNSELAPILLIRLPKMDNIERNKKIDIPQFLDINGIQFELKSAICHTGNDLIFQIIQIF